MKAINITAYTDNASQIEAIKAVIKALNIKYKISNIHEDENTYDPNFVSKIERGRADIKNGKGIAISMDELKELCK